PAIINHNTDVIIRDGTIGNVYGGGNAGNVVGETLVSLLNGSVSGSVSGSGSGSVSSDSQANAASGETRLQKALLRSVTPAGALAYMVFILLYFPCIATFVAIKNESGGWKWAIFTAVYTILLAWVAAFITFRIALLFGL
ncbi:MAG: hypothetical protein IKB85_03965, partial [Bacteroidales bacterium]|nr:hypothetical protein [Bacteroidales bacterium]